MMNRGAVISPMIRGVSLSRHRQFPQSRSSLPHHPLVTLSVSESRQLGSSSGGDEKLLSTGGNIAEARDMVKPPPISLCQINNHPDFRLRQAKARLERDKGGSGEKMTEKVPKPVIKTGASMQMQENPIRSNDGTSSGALAADRLRNSRRKAFENMDQSFAADESPQKINVFARPVKEQNVTIDMIENPVRSSDGTSSGALASSRLRRARRKVIENMKTQLPISSLASEHTAAKDTHHNSSQPLQSKSINVREVGLSIYPMENPARSSDGTSSGACAADRLRIARRKILESMAAPLAETSSLQQSEIGTIGMEETGIPLPRHSKNVREAGLSIYPMENPTRSSDGTSSGARAADRLRIARRKMLESMAAPLAETSSMQQSEKATLGKKEACVPLPHHSKNVREVGLSIYPMENPTRSSDGTSSGARAADRLRIARRKILESMAAPLAETSSMQQSEIGTIGKEEADVSLPHHTKNVREVGLSIYPMENPTRSSDGTSSGARAADRLRMARRKMLESMAAPLTETSSMQQSKQDMAGETKLETNH